MAKGLNSGFRRVNFKDYVQEASGGAPNDGYLWEALTPASWSIGLGAGALPTTWKGLGFRHLVTAGGAAYERKYTIAPGANDWWHTIQGLDTANNRYAHEYDFMFRTSNFGAGVYFGYFVEHGGSPAFVESAGYRVMFTATHLYLQKFGGGVWSTIATLVENFAINTDYYVRITYWPEDYVWLGRTFAFEGIHIISVTTDVDKRGQFDAGYLEYQDGTPLTGSANTKLMVGGENGAVVQFDCITYSNGFQQKPEYVHYYSSLEDMSTKVDARWPQPKATIYKYFDEGNRVELWTREIRTNVTVLSPFAVTRDYYSVLKADLMVTKVKQSDIDNQVEILFEDEFTAQFESNDDEATVQGADYDAFIQSDITVEYQGQSALNGGRVVYYPGVAAVFTTAISRSWAWKGGPYKELLRIISFIDNGWFFWNPAGFIQAQTAPVATGKTIDMSAQAVGDYQPVVRVDIEDYKRTQYANQVDQHYDAGAGIMAVTSVSSAADIFAYGPSTFSRIDVTLPVTEAGLVVQNRYDQMHQDEPPVDVWTQGYGMDFFVGNQVALDLPQYGINEGDYTLIEQEFWWMKDPRVSREKAGLVRHRFGIQPNPYGDLPKYASLKKKRDAVKEQETDKHDHFWT